MTIEQETDTDWDWTIPNKSTNNLVFHPEDVESPLWTPKPNHRLLIVLAVLAVWAGWTYVFPYLPGVHPNWMTAPLDVRILMGLVFTLLTPLLAILLWVFKKLIWWVGGH